MVTTFKNKTVALIKTIDENSYSHEYKTLKGEAYTLLTNNEDNSINIKIIKESWNKEEVIEHMWLAYKKSNTVFSDQKVLRKEFDEWIKNII
jgi:hypothetical protein